MERLAQERLERFIRHNEEAFIPEKGEGLFWRAVPSSCYIHPSVAFEQQALKYTPDEDGRLVGWIHNGGIVIGENVSIMAHTVIHRGSEKGRVTQIGEGSKVGSLVNIGHNVSIGKNCIIGPSASIGGSVTIGDDCFIGMGAVIKNGVEIMSNNMIGAGAVVVEDIRYCHGVCVGNPAKCTGELWDGKWWTE